METNPTKVSTKSVIKTPTLPRTDSELIAVAKSVSARWMENQWLTLQWTSAPEFKSRLEGLTSEIQSKNSVRSGRPQLTFQLQELEDQMDTAAVIVKSYLKESFGTTAAPNYYANFGIVKYRTSYILPLDKTKRSEALDLMVPAIKFFKFEDKKYGTAFWTSMRTQYNALLETAKEADSAVSLKVGVKNLQLAEIRDTLNAIINVLKGNFPKMWKAELRNWGLHKEKY